MMPGLTTNYSPTQQQGGLSFATPQSQTYSFGDPTQNSPASPALNPQQAFASGGLTQNYAPPASTGVLGASTGPAATSGGGAPAADPHINPSTGNWDDNYYAQQMANAAGGVSQAQIQAAQDQYAQMRAQLEAQKPVLQSAYDLGNQGIDTALQQSQTQAQSQKDLLQNQTNTAMGINSQNYQQDQGQNRELARSLGSFGTDYAQLQNKTSNNFTNQQSQMQGDLGARLNDINGSLTAMQQQAQQQKAQLANQLQTGMQQIVLNENATDMQKADAINQIRADFGTKMAAINQSLLQFHQQSQLAAQQIASYAAMYGKAGSGFNPSQYVINPGIGPSTTLGAQGVSGLTNDTANPTGLISMTPDQSKNAFGF